VNRALWTTVRVRGGDRAALIVALFGIGAEGVQELDDEIVTHLRAPEANEVAAAIRRVDGRATVELAPTPDVDWSVAWRAGVRAHRVGGLVVTPPWLADDFAATERIVIEPQMAFGTGEHETTRGMLRLLQSAVRPGSFAADLGTGSGVLAIAAAKLGARRVVGIELDSDAIGNAEDNIARNDVAERVTIIEGDAAALLPLVAPVNLVLANIISSVLLDLLPTIRDCLSPGGEAILSGILDVERTRMLEALRDWTVVAEDREGSWWSVRIARP